MTSATIYSNSSSAIATVGTVRSSTGLTTGSNMFTPAVPDPKTVARIVSTNKRVVLDVGGERHQVMWATLQRVPHSRLGRLRQATTHEAILQLCDDYDLTENMYFFDRHPRSFGVVLNFYRTGKLHLVEVSISQLLVVGEDCRQKWIRRLHCQPSKTSFLHPIRNTRFVIL